MLICVEMAKPEIQSTINASFQSTREITVHAFFYNFYTFIKVD